MDDGGDQAQFKFSNNLFFVNFKNFKFKKIFILKKIQVKILTEKTYFAYKNIIYQLS